MNIQYTDNFLKEAKQLSKKFKLLKQDLQDLIQDITINKDFGVDLGSNLYKKRVKNSSIPTGKSGGFRVIIYYQVEDNIVLISIYSKTQKDNISDEDIEDIFPKEYLVYIDFLNNFYTIDYEGKCYMDKVSELVESINFDSILEKSEVGKRIASIEERFENDSFFDKITAGLEVGLVLLRPKTEITDALNEVLDLIINQFEIIKREINS